MFCFVFVSLLARMAFIVLQSSKLFLSKIQWDGIIFRLTHRTNFLFIKPIFALSRCRFSVTKFECMSNRKFDCYFVWSFGLPAAGCIRFDFCAIKWLLKILRAFSLTFDRNFHETLLTGQYIFVQRLFFLFVRWVVLKIDVLSTNFVLSLLISFSFERLAVDAVVGGGSIDGSGDGSSKTSREPETICIARHMENGKRRTIRPFNRPKPRIKTRLATTCSNHHKQATITSNRNHEMLFLSHDSNPIRIKCCFCFDSCVLTRKLLNYLRLVDCERKDQHLNSWFSHRRTMRGKNHVLIILIWGN